MIVNLDPVSHAALRATLIGHAAGSKAPYPQYDGYFDRWILCLVTDETEFKGSSHLPSGRIVLASPDVRLDPGIPASRSTYCVETGSIVAMPHESIRPL